MDRADKCGWRDALRGTIGVVYESGGYYTRSIIGQTRREAFQKYGGSREGVSSSSHLTWTTGTYGYWNTSLSLRTSTIHSSEYEAWLGPSQVLPVPHDCTDGYLCAYWRGPSAYLDPNVRTTMSSFYALGDVVGGLGRLEADLRSGRWEERYGSLLALDTNDVGYRLVIASYTASRPTTPLSAWGQLRPALGFPTSDCCRPESGNCFAIAAKVRSPPKPPDTIHNSCYLTLFLGCARHFPIPCHLNT